MSIALTTANAPQTLLPVRDRILIALGAAALVAVACIAAGQASRTALETTSAALARDVTHVSLPAVVITAHRDGRPSSAMACAAGQGTTL